MGKIAALPNLVNATGVETLLRLPSSARFDESPVHGKSFPLRKTISCSLQVEFSTDRGAASGKYMEAMATVFCKRGNACETCASDAQTCQLLSDWERRAKCVCRRGGNDCEQHSSLQHQLKSSLITAQKHRGYQHHQPLSVRIVGDMSVSTADAEGEEKHADLASENTFKIKG